MKRKFWFAALAAALVLLLGAESDLPCTVEEDELSFTLDFAPVGEEAPVLIRLIRLPPGKPDPPFPGGEAAQTAAPPLFVCPRGRFAPSEGCQSGRTGRRRKRKSPRLGHPCGRSLQSAGFVRAPFRSFFGIHQYFVRNSSQNVRFPPPFFLDFLSGRGYHRKWKLMSAPRMARWRFWEPAPRRGASKEEKIPKLPMGKEDTAMNTHNNRYARGRRPGPRRRDRNSPLPMLVIALATLLVIALAIIIPRCASGGGDESVPAWSPVEATPTQALSAPTATPAPQTTQAVQAESSGAQEGENAAATQTAGDPAATPATGTAPGTDASALPQASPTSESLSDDSYTADEVHGPRPTAEADGYLPIFSKAETTEKIIAITVDDCNQTENLRQIVQCAIDNGGKLTILPIGQNLERESLQGGHPLRLRKRHGAGKPHLHPPGLLPHEHRGHGAGDLS